MGSVPSFIRLVLLHARRAILLTLGWGPRTLKGKRSFVCRSTTPAASEGSRGDQAACAAVPGKVVNRFGFGVIVTAS